MNMEKQAQKLMKSAKSSLTKAKRKYVCRSLKDLIKAYRACTTRSEEQALVKKEAAHIRDLFREGDKAFRRRNIAKLLFFHMNGYPTDFGMTECIKLCASSKYGDKRIAYLGLMILVDETEEILMLMTNCLKQDLNSDELQIVSLALNVLGDIASVEMVRDLLPDIEKHLLSSNPYIRKKAALAAVRAVKKLSPEETASVMRDVPAVFDIKSPAVHISGAALISALCEQSNENVPELQVAMTPVLVNILRDHLLGSSRGNAETMISGIKNPFLQVKLLSTIRLLVQQGASQELLADVWDVLAQVASNTDSAKVAGCAVLYECVRTITSIPAERSLRELGVNILGKFLTHKESTVRYIALQELTRVVDADGPTALSTIDGRKEKILAGLHEVDPTVRKRAAELIYKVATQANVEEIVKEMLAYIDKSSSPEAKEDGCWKVFLLLERLGPSDEWKVETFVKALSSADMAMPEELISSFIALVSSRPNVQAHAVSTLFNEALRAGSANREVQGADPFTGNKSSETNGQASEKLQSSTGSVKRKPRLERVAMYILGEHGEAAASVGLQAPRIIDAFERVLDASESTDERWMNTYESTSIAENKILREVAMTGLVKFACRIVGGPVGSGPGQGLGDPILAITSGGENTKANLGSSILSLPPAPAPENKVQEQGLGTDLLASMGLDMEAEPRALQNGGSKALVPAVDSLLSSQTDSDAGALMAVDGDAGTSGSGHPVVDRVRRILLARVKDSDLETQQRACEYLMLLHDSLGGVLASTLAPMPPLDFEKVQARARQRKELRTVSSQASLSNNNGGGLLLDLMGDSGDKEALPAALPPPPGSDLLALPSTGSPKDGGLDLDDIMGGLSVKAEPSHAQAQVADLSMLGVDNKGSASGITASAAGPSQAPDLSMLGLSDIPPSAEEAAAESEPQAVHSTTIFESSALRVYAEFFKDDRAQAGKVRAEVYFTNKSTEPLRQFVFLVAVPKYMQLRMHPASTSELQAAGGQGKQTVELDNSLHGQKPIQMRFRVQYESGDGSVVEQGVASGLEVL